MTKSALITGISGQDGAYLAELLLDKGYELYGIVRRLSTPNITRIEHVADRITLLDGDLTDQSSLNIAMQTAQPDEVYNLAAQSFVATSMFGAAEEIPQNEKTLFHPRSPYAVAKVYGYYATVNYRESYDMFCCNGILFNHESPRRGIEFVTRKITDGVARIHHGPSKELRLGNLDAKRDWGYAGDYVKAMWLMLQQKEADDYVIATGESHSVKKFVELAFSEVGLDWQEHVKMDERFMRPADVPELRGDASKAREKLGWKPETSFEELVKMMVRADVEKYYNK
jgi:GDPmannose 4,6-dehydratase